ncbi:hypothetical protein [Flavobacterium sp.]|uniref:hypothetical protein n=1 Tax=Flavobacterium sp. TaxID=239 RepID=UPI002FDB6247
MNLKNTLLPLITSVLISIPAVMHSQIAITNVGEIAKIKQGTTFFAMKDPNSPKVKEYVDIIKKTWNFSKVECIKYTDVEKNIAPNNSFVTVGGNMTSVSTMGGSNADYSNTHLYFELWTSDGSFVYDPKKRKHFDDKNKIQIARLELFTDFATLVTPSYLYRSDYDGAGHIRNWSPGILKNYIQCLTAYLNKGAERKLYDETLNKDALKKLSTETLFVPNYVLTKFNKFTGDETKQHEEKDIFEDYTLKYQLISNAELSTKITTETTPFYYLLYIKSSTDKFVSVFNSATGEMIYSVYTTLSYNLKSSDLKDLQKAVQKK